MRLLSTRVIAFGCIILLKSMAKLANPDGIIKNVQAIPDKHPTWAL